MKLIDLHVHSIYSDGEYEPKKLVELAKKNNIGVLSITDHDTIDGTKKLVNLNDPDLFYIHGIEVSTKCDTGQMHILGYDFDVNNENLNKMVSKLKENRIYNMELLLSVLLNDFNISFSKKDIDELFLKPTLGRPDLARLLVKYGYVTSVKEAFSNYLIYAYDACDGKRRSLTKEEIIPILKSANGLVSLAHCKTLKLDLYDLKKEILYLKSLGLDAIEISHELHDNEYRKSLREIKDEYKLLESGGTDFHGPFIKPNIKLGTGVFNNIKIKKLSLVDEIKKRANHS